MFCMKWWSKLLNWHIEKVGRIVHAQAIPNSLFLKQWFFFIYIFKIAEGKPLSDKLGEPRKLFQDLESV